MAKVIGRKYTTHKEYDVNLDKDILNMKIRIFGDDFDKTGVVDYEGTVCKFIKERIPAEALVERIPELKYEDEISYRFHGGENFIQRVR